MKHVLALHNEYLETVQPILHADGRNNVSKVALYISRNIRDGISEDELAKRLLFNARRSKKDRALIIWASDLKKLQGNHAVNDVIKLVRFYKKRAALTAEEKAHYEQIRRAEAGYEGA